ncbi:surface antigen BspA-like [Trichomonas vaginalis G3]|uniref:Surface antigen BspA-like n=1 Tax=Trichomonas vaginalis (strain ATCC PRA-98 / G3) TaxID=412133 RepID=A2DMU8_TRIV3|nr:BspA type Leucine rich repeat region (6 copies) family [Trichomonas vaginalis G3]EAY18319.1 surface antigen BspA-like [Trichomonas vaginalis G3]KAI5541859.1 BspA type Leucine rich repeat region (6 copies) family [Trichomonas vaginalis G3]|eukprot:XP_001579305.1 surface antigen BspA-like [Trichomonas vaginalis G3]
MRAKDIFDRQFWGSYRLEKASFPEGVLVFGQYTFINCTNLKTVSLPSSLWSIGDGTFYNCISLQSIDVSMLNYLPLYSFYNCSSLTTVKIGSSVKLIGEGAFYNTNIKSFTVPDTCILLQPKAFAYTRSLKEVTIGQGIKSLPALLFSGSYVKKVKISSQVIFIDPSAFNNAPYLTVSFSSNSPYFTISDHMIIEKVSGRLIASFGALPIDYSIPSDVEFIPPNALLNNAEIVYTRNGVFFKEPSAAVLRIPENVRYIDANNVLGVYVACSDGKYFHSNEDGDSVISVAESKYSNAQLFGNQVTTETCDSVKKRIPSSYLWYHDLANVSDHVRRSLIIAVSIFAVFIVAIIILYFVYPSWHFMPRLCGKEDTSGSQEGGSYRSFSHHSSRKQENTNYNKDEYDGIAPRQTRVDRPRQEWEQGTDGYNYTPPPDGPMPWKLPKDDSLIIPDN